MTHPSIDVGGQELIRQGFIHQFKGAALSIVLALYAGGGGLGVADLAEATGWSRAHIQRVLGRLHAQGWVEQRRRYHGWRLVDRARHELCVWLQAGENDPSSAQAAPSGTLEEVNHLDFNDATTSRELQTAVRGRKRMASQRSSAS